MDFLQKYLFTNVYIYIESVGRDLIVHQYKIADGKTKAKESKKFSLEQNDVLPEVMLDYISKYEKKFSYTYISVIINSQLQYTIPTKNITKEKANAIKNNNKIIHIDKQWKIYCNTKDIENTKSMFDPLSIDYIVSPFALLWYLYKNNSDKSNTLYLLSLKSILVMVIFKQDIAVASKTLVIESQASEGMGGDTMGEDSVDDLLDMNIDDDFEDNEDPSIEDLEMDMGDSAFSIESTPSNNTLSPQKDQVQLQEQIVEALEEIIDEFYSSPECVDDDDFIESITIFNDGVIDNNITHYIKDEIMLEVYSKQVSTQDTLVDMFKKKLRE